GDLCRLLPRPPCSPPFPYTTLFRSHAPPLAQSAVERLAQRQRTVFGRVVVVDMEVALARQRDIEPGVATERLEQMVEEPKARLQDRKSTRLNSSHGSISYAVFCLKK